MNMYPTVITLCITNYLNDSDANDILKSFNIDPKLHTSKEFYTLKQLLNIQKACSMFIPN